MPQLPSVNLTCDTVGVIQPAVTMTTSLQLKDALKLLTQNEIKTRLTYGDIWEGDHFTMGLVKCIERIVLRVVIIRTIHI